MFTQCPQCDAIFQLSASQLKAANGEVRCGQCLSVFNALDHLSEEVPQSQESETADDLAHEANQYCQWSEETVEESAPTSQPEEITPPETTIPEDVFSEVIAEVSANDIPVEEIDQFEKFLDADGAAIEDDADTISTLAPSSTEDLIDTDSVADFPSEDASPSTDESRIGDIDNVDTGLETPIDIDDDEFAELDAYLNATEDEPDNDTTAYTKTAPTDDDAIIIETADLAPVTSPGYTDTPDISGQKPIDTSTTDASATSDGPPLEAEHVANESPPSSDGAQTVNIPNLILDDLHAAKEEQLRPSNAPWIAASLVLMLTLVLQVVYQSRDEMARDATFRPWLIQMCNVLGCTLSQPYDIKQIEIIGRDVRSHPNARRALVVSTTLINNASFVQPFPLLTMVFSDINGKTLAQRRFTPREYLNNNIDLAAGMTPDMPVRIELELVDPGKAAVNYEFHAEADPRRTRPLT